MMAILHVRNVPDDLHRRLHDRAAKENRSLSAEVIHLLEQALEEPEVSTVELLERIRRRRLARPASTATLDSVALLREDRER